ncbi:MAG TPA: NAD-dependent epimerase/dehydratase family protein [Solirubrobacterales bacterium]|jgi:nucleoside-diphosphate-sugar epimerase|nr:NAD-dependent epimerase/dehydratase family protein [Solirubrobacterales bacterium]
MKVVVTGATGNVGTSVLAALAEEPAVTEIVGVARRRPPAAGAKTTWLERDIVRDDLAHAFAGADAVVHLAWAIQPSHDEAMLHAINVAGSERVFGAAAEAGVGALVYASSVGAYAPGPKDRSVDESWPATGIESSFYSRHKAIVEGLLDALEDDVPELRVVRMRPALIFKGEAASEIRRLFAGPFLPGFLLRPQLIPVVPRIPELRFQAVHSLDVGDAYRRAVVTDARGAYNLAADPVIDPDELARMLDARTVPVPARAARVLTDVTWRLHVQPTPPGWLDLALGVPVMDSSRARRELGWSPARASTEALEELLEGLRRGEGARTPPLDPEAGGPGRVGELRTGVGEKQ